MKTLISKYPINSRISNPQIVPSVFRFHFPLRGGSISYRHISRYKCFNIPSSVHVSPIKASSSTESMNYGGWDNDFDLGTWSANLGESTQLRNFLNSIGSDDKKYIFMFLSGLVCALAISRVRISTLILFPASVLVFGIGFSFGFVKGGSFNGLSSNKRRSKEENLKAYSGKLRNVVDYFKEFDVKVDNLKNSIQRAIDSNRITVGDLENYVSLTESLRLLASNARNVVEGSIDNAGNSIREHSKSSKKEAGGVGFELFQFLGSLFAEKSMATKNNVVKDDVKLESLNSGLNNQTGGHVILPVVQDRVFGSSNKSKRVPNRGVASLNEDRERGIFINSNNGKIRSDFLSGRDMSFVDSEEYNYESSRVQFVDTNDICSRTSDGDESELWETEDNLLDSKDFDVRFKHTKTEASFVHERLLHKSSRSYRSSHNSEKSENEGHRKRQFYEDESCTADYLYAHENEATSSSSLKFSDDVAFDKYLTESSVLLREAKDSMRNKDDGQHVEIMLNRSASLLSQAITLKPMSLLAVGQLGNTYLLHGELKLHVSRELRTLLASNDPTIGKGLGLDDRLSSRDKIVSHLINACEECEDLLVRAGRKYRLALSIDGDDVRSLYNWGLALSFRAQLIADIGPEAAFDADKLFLAAIDKFDAMMTKGNIHTPDALFRWGVTLQQRSRLRPRNSKEKVKLLQQAKRLYEDALHMDSKNLQVRDALSSCVSELKYRYL